MHQRRFVWLLSSFLMLIPGLIGLSLVQARQDLPPVDCSIQDCSFLPLVLNHQDSNVPSATPVAPTATVDTVTATPSATTTATASATDVPATATNPPTSPPSASATATVVPTSTPTSTVSATATTPPISSPTATSNATATASTTPPTGFSQINWTSTPTPRSYPFSTSEAQGAVVGGKLYVFGGFQSNFVPYRKSNVYDPANNTWTALPDLPKGVTHTGMTTDGQRYIYYAGGYIENSTQTGQIFGSRAVWRFDTQVMTYTALPLLPVDRAAGVLVLLDNKLHYIGGTNIQRTVDVGDHYVLDLGNLAAGWTTAAALPNPRHHAAGIAVGGAIYFIGGQHKHDGNLVPQADVHRYNPDSNSWEQMASLPMPLNHMGNATVVIDGRIIVLGGQVNNQQAINNVYAYVPASNTWSELTGLPMARHSAVAGAINGVIYYTTGATTSKSYKGIPVAP